MLIFIRLMPLHMKPLREIKNYGRISLAMKTLGFTVQQISLQSELRFTDVAREILSNDLVSQCSHVFFFLFSECESGIAGITGVRVYIFMPIFRHVHSFVFLSFESGVAGITTIFVMMSRFGHVLIQFMLPFEAGITKVASKFRITFILMFGHVRFVRCQTGKGSRWRAYITIE